MPKPTTVLGTRSIWTSECSPIEFSCQGAMLTWRTLQVELHQDLHSLNKYCWVFTMLLWTYIAECLNYLDIQLSEFLSPDFSSNPGASIIHTPTSVKFGVLYVYQKNTLWNIEQAQNLKKSTIKMAQGQNVWKFPLKSKTLVIIFVRARTPKASPVQVPFSSSWHLICSFLNICIVLYAL